MNEDLALIKKLDAMRAEHRALDEQAKAPRLDEFSRKRLQKLKLALRDRIMELEQILYPDVIA